jgi:hypothetical protein
LWAVWKVDRKVADSAESMVVVKDCERVVKMVELRADDSAVN